MSGSGDSFVGILRSNTSQAQRTRDSIPDMASRFLAHDWILSLAYVLDWIVIVAIAAIGGGLNFVRPSHRPFSLLDLSISYPIKSELSIVTVFLVAGVGSALVILLVVLVFVPGRHQGRDLKRSELLRLKAWELEKGLAGLALALATAFFITQGSKQLFGKPRPNMLARCQPDLTNITAHVIGGYGQTISPEWTLVDISICTTSDLDTLDDGFRSFPSGHSSFSWAGLFYLTLFLCAKFNITLPHLPWQHRSDTSPRLFPRMNDFELQENTRATAGTRNLGTSATSMRRVVAHDSLALSRFAASPPNHLLALALIPIGTAVYISSTRFTDFYHFGFDIIVGSLLGIFTAWCSFRWYHPALSRGSGWAWGARDPERAFGIGVGTEGYVDHRRAMNASGNDVNDLEAGGAGLRF